jgi:hypothetical protein
MSSFLLKFEAIESRIASYSCPRGTTGRVHALRLRRRFQTNSRQQQSAGLGGQLTDIQEPKSRSRHIPDTKNGYENAIDGGPVSSGQRQGGKHSTRDHVVKSLLDPFDRRWPNMKVTDRKNTTNRLWIKRTGVRQLGEGELGDVLPLEFRENVVSSGYPDEEVLYSALRKGNPHVVLKTLISLVQKDGYAITGEFFKKMPQNTFSEMLRCMDPKNFLGRHQKLQMEFSPHYTRISGLPHIDKGGYYRFCTVFLSQVQGIIQARRQEQSLSLVDFKYLLKCARGIGNGELAYGIWRSMTSTPKSAGVGAISIVPDAECYNLYLETRCLGDILNPLLRFRLRIIPDNFLPRTWTNGPYTLRGHRVGAERGIKTEVSRIFMSMVQAGISGNEETFCLMMTAVAREGDTAGVASILKRVWGIDVETLLNTDDDKAPPPKHHARDSPFYPSEKLLYTIAHVYGINNSIPTALRLVDFVSRQYSVPIPLPVWNELLQWTFVLSIKRTGPRRENFNIGQLPSSAVSNLWATMTSEPYNAKPTMEMYNRLLSNLLLRQRFGEAKKRMEDGYNVHKLAVLNLSRKILILQSTFGRGPVYEQRSRDLAFAQLCVKHNRQYIRRWVRLLIIQGSDSLKYNPTWSPQDLPKFIEKWEMFLPKKVEYNIGTGRVRFSSFSHAKNKERSARLAMKNLGMRRRLVERGFKER